MKLSECDFMKRDYYMIMEENNILKWQLEMHEEYSGPWYDNAIVGFIGGVAVSFLCVWGASKLK